MPEGLPVRHRPRRSGHLLVITGTSPDPRKFKSHITQRIAEFQRDISRQNITLYAWPNTLNAKDDEKSIFLYGPRSLSAAHDLIEIIVNEARSMRIRVRLVGVNTDFAGDPAFKYSSEPEVEGEAFWEHFSRLQAAVKSKEVDTRDWATYVWLADELTKRARDIFESEEWHRNAEKDAITTEIENWALRTSLFGGPVRTVD